MIRKKRSNPEDTYRLFWELCDLYEKIAGSRTALNNFLTGAFRKAASLDHVLTN